MIRATAISVIDQGLLSGVNFLLALLLIRFATTEEYGLYTQLVGLQSLFSVCMRVCSSPRSCRCSPDCTE